MQKMNAPIRHLKTIDRINNKNLSRTEMATLEARARDAIMRGDAGAQSVLDAIAVAMEKTRYIVFIGFCPGGSVRNRLDIAWKQQGICTFEYFSSDDQFEKFVSIRVGDLIVLRKRQQIGKTMRLYGHGRVTARDLSNSGDRILQVKWSEQRDEIVVPLMSCNEAINVRDIIKVEAVMPLEFWDWLRD
jgi:hypothetical protein